MSDPKITVLHDFHKENGAQMDVFANYEMPLWYHSGARKEHLAVITKAGLFDTSYMGIVTLRGLGAKSLLQYCFTKDLDSCIGRDRGELAEGRCVYGLFLHEDGSVLDDAIVYRLQQQSYMVVVNAGKGGDVADHLLEHNRGDVIVEDLTGQVGKMDIQGPQAGRILQKILNKPAEVLDGMVFFSFKGGLDKSEAATKVTLTDSIELLVSRTGYTGEFGFELYMDANHLPRVWAQVLEAGEEFGAIPCGLASRDSLRTGAMLPLSQQDIGPWPFANNPWVFALPFAENQPGFSKVFHGSAALEKLKWEKHTLGFAGFDSRKIRTGEENFVLDMDGEKIGEVLTCTTDMAIDRKNDAICSIAQDKELIPKGLSCGFVLLDRSIPGGERVVLTDGKRDVPVEIRDEIRPNKTARKAMAVMLDEDSNWRREK